VEHYYGGEVAHVEQFVHTARLAAEHCVFSLLYDIVYPVYTKRVRTMPVLVNTLFNALTLLQYIAEDRKFTQKMAEFADITTPDLIDNPKFWLLDDKKGTYAHALTQTKALQHQTCPACSLELRSLLL
jgi:hypothetical protein